MPDQNKVAFNIPQSKTDQEKAQARSNIGVLHNVTFISNTSSPAPTLARVQAMLDAGDYVVLIYNDGVNPVVPMTVLQDVRTGGLNFVSFVCVSDSGAITVKLTGSGFGTPTTKLLDAGKLEVITVSNGAASMAGLHMYIGTMIGLGKIPLVKYEESVTPSQFGYYSMMYRDQLATNFVRVTENAVKILSVSSSDQITINTYLYDTDKIETITVQHGATTWQDGPAMLTHLATIGKTPLVKYDETGSSDWGYYWLAYVTSTDYVFVRMTSTHVLTIAITISSGAITYQSYPVGMDLSIVGPSFSEHVDYLRGDLVIYDDALKRFSNNHSAGSWVAADAITDNIVHNLGRVKNGGEIIDTGLHDLHWIVQNNALTKIDTQMNASGVTFEIDVDLDQGEVPNFVVQLKSRFGGTWNIVARYRIPGTSAVSETVTCWYSLDAGNVIPEDVPVQITCVGNCWTWAVYVDPTAVQLSSVLQSPEVPDVVGNTEEDM